MNRQTVSRKLIVPIVAGCLIVAAFIVPLVLRLPRWVEVEAVLAAWWLIWVVVLSVLLFRGDAIDDDLQGPKPKMRSYDGAWLAEGCGDLGCLLAGGAEIGLLIGAIVVAILAVVFLVELAIPAIALVCLASIGGMVARAVNDRHHCRGRLGLSILWASVWATVYTGPLLVVAIWLAGLAPSNR